MSSSTSPSTSSFVTMSERLYLYIRQYAVKNIFDAAVELITNSNDAYTRMNTNLVAAGQPALTSKTFLIDYHANTNTIVFTDNAIGVSGTDMPGMFLQVGTYSSSHETRGFFSRGAKDVSILGNVTFQSIKNGLYSSCTLSNEAYGEMVAIDVPVTENQRHTLGIPVNGTAVSLTLLPQFAITNSADITALPENISTIATLRNIMTCPKNDISFRYFNEEERMSEPVKLSYEYPECMPLLNLTYTVPGYPDATAIFTVKQAITKIPQPADDSRLQFGFLLQSANSIYEVNTIQSRFRYNPYIAYVFGTLQCDYIAWLMYDIDKNGSSAANPMIIIDPSRTSGLNPQHPFTDALYGIVAKRLDLILQQLDTSMSSGGVALNNFNNIIADIANFGSQFLGEALRNQDFKPSYQSNLIKAIQDDRSQYVQVEQNYIQPTFEQSSIAPPEFDNLSDTDLSKNWIYVLDSNKTLVKIATNGINPLSPSITQEEMAKLADAIKQNINTDDFSKNPYIYAQNDNGEMVKLFIYQHGVLDEYTGAENTIAPQQTNALQIIFTNDINIDYQYNITYVNGSILVKININDPLVKKYIATTSVTLGASTTITEAGNISNNSGYIFLAGMFTEVFSRILIDYEVKKGTLSATTDYYTMMHAYQTMANQVKIPLDELFQTYYKTSISNMIDAFVIADDNTLDLQSGIALKSKLGLSELSNVKILTTDVVGTTIGTGITTPIIPTRTL